MKTSIKILAIFTVLTTFISFGNNALAADRFFEDPSAVAPNSGAGSPNTSYNWAGYIASSGSYTGVSGSWVIPTVPNTNSFSADAAWVGIGGVSSQDLIQAGTQAIVNGQGQVTYQAWYETLPQVSQPVSMAVNPGDSMTASLTQSSQNQWLVSLRDNTSGQNFQTTITYNSSMSSAEWIEEMPSQGTGSFIPLDNFGGIDFTNTSAIQNGAAVNLTQAAAQPITMLNLSQQALASVSAIGVDGSSFIVTRTTATPSTPSVSKRIGFGRSGWQRRGVGINGYTPKMRTFGFSSGSLSQQQLQLLRQQLQMFSQMPQFRISFSFSR